MPQKPDLLSQAPGIAREAAPCADHPVAGNDQGNGIVPHSPAHRLGSHPRLTRERRHFSGDFAVGGSCTIGNLPEHPPHRLAKGTAGRRQGQLRRIRPFPCEVCLQPILSLLKNRQAVPLLQLCGGGVRNGFLSLQPQPHKGLPV